MEDPAKLRGVVDFWKAFDLDGRRSEFDQQGLEITELQDQSNAGRKRLAESTKAFKRLPEEEKTANCGGIIKSYQEEIDKITKRARFSENAYMALYKSLYEAPDPVEVLLGASSVNDAVAKLEAENIRLTTELDEHTKELSDMRNQDVTVQRLEKQLKEYERKVEQAELNIEQSKKQALKTDSKATKAEERIQQEINLHLEEKVELQGHIDELQNKILEGEKQQDRAQASIFELRTKFDEDLVAKQSEIEILGDDMDRVASKVATLEREKEMLVAQVGVLKEREGSSNREEGERSNVRLRLLQADLEDRDARLTEARDLERQLQKGIRELKTEHATTVGVLEGQIASAAAKLDSAESQMQALPTVKERDSLLKQLRVLQSMHGIECDGDGNLGVDIDKVLIDAKRRLEAEVASLKVLLEEKDRNLAASTAKYTVAQESVGEKAALITKLEEAIRSFGSSAPAPGPDAAPAVQAGGSDAAIPPLAGNILEKAVQSATPATAAADTSVPETESNGQSMLQIVIGQRDRFKARITELEKGNRKYQENEDRHTAEIKTLRDDNVKLYGKIRYLRCYESSKKRKGSAAQFDDSGTGVDIENSAAFDEAEEKYRESYEESQNPFTRFNKKEKFQLYDKMNTTDKITLGAGKIILGNKPMRTFFFFYACCLHFLVFLSLYKLSHIHCPGAGAVSP